jgi:hypothetical protein
MKKMIKRTTTIVTKLTLMLFALGSLSVAAQKPGHEFSVYVAPGISTYCFQPPTKGVNFAAFSRETIKENKPGYKVNTSVGFSGDFGVGFTGFISQQVGINVNAAVGLFNVKSKVNTYNIIYDYKDNYGVVYDKHIKLINYTEIHKSAYVSIPVMLQFQTKQKQYWNWTRSQKAGFYAMGGVKLHLLFNNKYEASVDSLCTAAYFPIEGSVQGTQIFAGLGGFNGGGTSGNLDFGLLVNLAFEAGVKWRIDNNIFVYTGIFFDCALNDPIKDSRQPYEKYSSEEDFRDLTLMKFSQRANLMVVGVKLRFAFTKNQRY